jgi:hypothetical protein
MRNDFYPRKMAEYITKEQLKKLGMEHVQLERDSTFGLALPEAQNTSELLLDEEHDKAIEVHADLLKVRS